MNANPAAETPGTRKARRKGRETVGKLTIREIVEKKDGYSWKTFLVQGWRTPEGQHGRKKFKTRLEAEAFIATKSVELTNAETALNNVVTRLTRPQVQEAEAAFSRLGNRYPLAQAVEYFLRHYAQPAKSICLNEACAAFLESRQHEGVRAVSLKNLRYTIGNFTAFMILRTLPSELIPEIEHTRSQLEAERSATIKEVVAKLDVALRPEVRRAAGSSDSVLALLQQKLGAATRDAISAARDKIELRRAPTERCIAAKMVADHADAKVSSVHEITSDDVEAFLRSLRGEDGGTASKKFWNNARADLHSFFGWCSSKQRRWCAENPASSTVKFKIARGIPHVLTVQQASDLMSYVATYKGGAVAKYFALALFAGLRTGTHGELVKLAVHPNREKLLDLDRRVIHVQPEISKTGQYRQTTIRPALLEWLTVFTGDIWPPNGERMVKHIRSRFSLPHDVLRHSFFSYLVSVEGSVERAALEGGNTEGILRRHYLNLANAYEGEAFWKIYPPITNREDSVER